jgi:glycosyltransferase involved in cell wall biosynthesis
VKILHVARRVTPAAWGGTETVVTSIAREQRRRGEVAAIYCTSALDRPGAGDVMGVPIRRFGYSYTRFRLGDDARAALDLKGGNPISVRLLGALLAEPGVEMLHAHTAQRLGAEVRWAARRRGIPYAVQLHGGELTLPASELDQMLGPTRGKLDWGKAAGALLGSRRVLRDANLVLVLSRAEREKALAELPGVRVELLPNGVDAARFRSGNRARGRARLGLPEGIPVLLTVARLDPQKNQEALVDVLAAAPAAHAVLAGPVTVPGYDDRIRTRSRAFGVDSRLHFAGAVTPESDELYDLYAAADAFVLPSRHEPFGVVVLEAWAAGLPVVATRAGGLADLVTDGDTGLLADVGDAKALAAAVTRILSDENLRLGLAGRAAHLVAESYDWPAVVGKLHALYREVGAGGKR